MNSNALLSDTEIVREFPWLNVATLRRWRMEKKGPRYHKVGARCWYSRQSIEEFLRNCAVDTAQVNG